VTKFVHRAFVCDRAGDFIPATARFVREGLAADDTVLVVGSEHGADGLREILGGDADLVEFHDAVSWYSQPTRAIAAYSSYILDNVGARLRVVAEPRWECASPVEASEWIRYESLVNQAFAELEASVLCVYDRSVADPLVVSGATITHTEIMEPSGPSPNPCYTDPRDVFAEIDRAPLPPAPPHAAAFSVGGADLTELRWFIGGHARGFGMSPARLNDLLVAATELATNAVRHGLPPVTCRLWADDAGAVLEVMDAGYWRPAEAPGFMPPDMVTPEFGLWGVRMLCPLVQIRTGPAGTTVRLRVSRT
jgi:DcmR-like sensory protein/histidine kinase-like protein